MYIEYYSDIHNESRRTDWLPLGIESTNAKSTILCLVGDIINISNLEPYLKKVSEGYNHTIYIPGNHEYYGLDLITAKEYLKSIKIDNVSILDDGYVTINDVEFIGSTLWTEFNNNPLYELEASYRIADFRYINYGDRKITPYTMSSLHVEAKNFIYERISKSTANKKVVLTHFLPSMMLKHQKRPMDAISYYYANTLPTEYFVDVDFWIYGHSHDKVNLSIDGCECRTNPVGYMGELPAATIDTFEI